MMDLEALREVDLTGQPAISVPSDWHSSGLTMGIQLIGGHFREARLLQFASAA